jgi:ribonucleotide monophosphatase NagD (HAD superfamily)
MLDADILGAENFGADSLLVLSGLYQGERRKNLEIEMLEKNIFPTYVLPSIALT